MGYFSQRKKHERENILLKVTLVTLGFLSISGLFLDKASDILNYVNAFRFQIYILTLLVFIYSIFLRRYSYSLCFAIIFLINYTIINASANIFIPNTVNDRHHIAINYQRHQPLSVEASGMLVLRNGRININNSHQAQFLTFEKNLHVFTVIAVDFSHYDYQKTLTSFNNLKKFIAQQDDPVIVMGNFGKPAWSPVFADFLDDTGMEVKNKLVLGDKHRAFNPFAIPQFYVLGFDNLGLNDLNFTYFSDTNPKVKAYLGFY